MSHTHATSTRKIRQVRSTVFTHVRSVFLLLICTVLVACASPVGASTTSAGAKTLRIVTTTGILADLVRNVAGERAHVTQMVPDGADPHSWEPSLRVVHDVAYADVAFTNYLLLEQHSLIRTLDANLPEGATSVSVAEEAAKHGATILPLVEDRSLDTVWLGLRVYGDGASLGATRSSTVDLKATAAEGPGTFASYLTTSFGAPDVSFSSSDGFQANDGYANDTAVLPAAAHQHMSWAFTEPGIYRVHFDALLRPNESATPVTIGGATAVFAVGVPATEIAQKEKRGVLASGHADITVDLDGGKVVLAADQPPSDATKETHTSSSAPDVVGTHAHHLIDLDEVVIEVPPRTLTQVPGASGYRFIGKPGESVYILPQAVLGKHVHGEIDPHLWHDVHNAAAYVNVIRDTLIRVDPEGASEYHRRCAEYMKTLEKLDHDVNSIIATIPQPSRRLVTTSDAFGYLANAYGMQVAGFVAPNPGIEPSVADRIRLVTTIKDLNIPAVFLEPNLARTKSTLATVANEVGVRVCPLYGDTLDANAPTYVDMMRANAHSLATCLGGHSKEKQ